jgi:alkylhydroperoxidase family enzyme
VPGAPTEDGFDPRRDTSAVLAEVLIPHPDITERLDDLHREAWRVADPVLLELCRLRIAQLLGCDAEQAARTPEALAAGLEEATVAELRAWPTSSRFGPRERAGLAFCEQFMIDVAGLDDHLAMALSDELGSVAFVDFVNALLIVEQRQRLRLAWERLLTGSAA